MNFLMIQILYFLSLYNSNCIVNSVLEFAENREKRINLHYGALNSSKNMFSLNKQTQTLMTQLKI